MEQIEDREGKLTEIIRQVKTEVLSQIDLSRESSDEEIQKLIFETVFRRSKEEFLLLEDRKKLAKSVFNALRKLDFVQELLEDDEISEIMINGPESIFVEKGGEIRHLSKTFDEHWQNIKFQLLCQIESTALK